MSELQLVNHAALLVSTPEAMLLSDPWIAGSAFNDGWDLLVPSVLPDLTAETRPLFVWYSHEHPDHFAPAWLKSLPEAVKRRTTVLYQRTLDHRVADFCRSAGVTVMEMDDGARYALTPDLEVMSGFVWEYDSWLRVTTADMTLLNLNDCRILDDEALAALATQVGPVDVLATQFSYAAWKGGPDQTALRRHYAEEKLIQVRRQIEALRPSWVLPFASFIYFSHEENRYMNDAVNSIDATVAVIDETPSRPMVMFPGDRWTPGTPYDSTAARAAWRTAFDPEQLTFRTSRSVPLDTLTAAAASFVDQLQSFNNRLFLAGLRQAPVGGFLRPLTIGLFDHPDNPVRFSAWRGLGPATGEPDVWMHSSSLFFIFRHGFGFDSLLVNGRFQADSDGFRRMSRAFGITIINNSGRSIGWKALKDFRYFASLLGTVSRFSDNAKAAEMAAPLTSSAA